MYILVALWVARVCVRVCLCVCVWWIWVRVCVCTASHLRIHSCIALLFKIIVTVFYYYCNIWIRCLEMMYIDIYIYIMSFFNVTIWLPVVWACLCARLPCVKRKRLPLCEARKRWAFYICLYLGVRKKKATIKSLILIKPSCCWLSSNLAPKRAYWVFLNHD